MVGNLIIILLCEQIKRKGSSDKRIKEKPHDFIVKKPTHEACPLNGRGDTSPTSSRVRGRDGGYTGFYTGPELQGDGFDVMLCK
ncbi:hypothetical protein L1987_18416 [Smallanthus sonchifolius]|uniref:Uncharacterized protein n=1 Tax=Smallanthus sonchifolius TaxID=185202 RepID=A0ACB9J342_9ASTR|nr:hypothetical protein L1987_18416 [Smallanthus sonchifolius]